MKLEKISQSFRLFLKQNKQSLQARICTIYSNVYIQFEKLAWISERQANTYQLMVNHVNGNIFVESAKLPVSDCL